MGKTTRASARRTNGPPAFARVISALRRLYGPPEPPAVARPLEIILYENVAYLAEDARREQAFQALKKRVGLTPAEILAAPRSTLREIASHGITPDQTVEKLREIATIAAEEFGGNLDSVVRLAASQAKKALKKFPSIGEPGGDKVLLFSRSQPILALDSNGLRVLLRLGFGREEKSYAKSYRSVQDALSGSLPHGYDALIEAHQLLRRHGQELCKRSRPHCEVCPLRAGCAYAQSRSHS